jgi:serine/threonine protein kinase
MYMHALQHVAEQQCVQVIQHIAERLEALHAAGYVHRDLKPANVMWLPRENRWTVIDFGCVAAVGASCLPAFSPSYAAPEAVRARRAGKSIIAYPCLDAWSLGVLTYELFTGKPWACLHESKEKVRPPALTAHWRCGTLQSCCAWSACMHNRRLCM